MNNKRPLLNEKIKSGGATISNVIHQSREPSIEKKTAALSSMFGSPEPRMTKEFASNKKNNSS
tara:strand:- start:1324 stop:1512 length:189 start_codon:yes stop_codon:yes gene_type:complete